MDEVIEYGTYMRAVAEAIVARKCGHGCVNDYERKLRDSMPDDEYYDLAEQNLQCLRNGGTWYPHLWNPSQTMMDIGVVMPVAPEVIEYDTYAKSWASEYCKLYHATHEKAVCLFNDLIGDEEYYESAQMNMDAFISCANVRNDGAKPTYFGIVLPSDMSPCSNVSSILGFGYVRGFVR